MWKKALSILLCTAMVLSTAMPRKAYAGEPNGSFALLNMKNTVPDNFNKAGADDPYGYGAGTPFLLSEQKELLVTLTSDWGEQVDYKVYDTLKSTSELTFASSTTVANNSTFSGYNSKVDNQTTVTPNTLSFTKTVAFDPDGSGRKDHVAYVGAWKDNGVYLFIYDTVKKKWGGVMKLGDMTWMVRTVSTARTEKTVSTVRMVRTVSTARTEKTVRTARTVSTARTEKTAQTA